MRELREEFRVMEFVEVWVGLGVVWGRGVGETREFGAGFGRVGGGLGGGWGGMLGLCSDA